MLLGGVTGVCAGGATGLTGAGGAAGTAFALLVAAASGRHTCLLKTAN